MINLRKLWDATFHGLDVPPPNHLTARGVLGPVPPRPEGWECELTPPPDADYEGSGCIMDPIWCEYYCGQPLEVRLKYPEVPTISGENSWSSTISGKTSCSTPK